MNFLEGWFREHFGRSVCKVMLLRNVGEAEYPIEQVLEGGGRLEGKVERRRWRVVGSKYFGFKDRFWKSDGMVYELKLENECYGRGEVRVQFLDVDSGEALNMDGRVEPYSSPLVMRRLLAVEHLKAIVLAAKGTNFQMVWFVMGFAIGGLLLFLVGQNLDAIVAGIGKAGGVVSQGVGGLGS